MNDGFLPIVLLGLLVGAFAVLSLGASALLRPSRPNRVKVSPYESGIQPVRLPRSTRFPIKFYVVAMLFIIFDIETIFLYPWAVAFRSLGLFGLVEMLVFIGLVFVAFVYVWQKGGLDWEGPQRAARGTTAVGYEPLPAIVERGPGEHPNVAPVARGRT